MFAGGRASEHVRPIASVQAGEHLGRQRNERLDKLAALGQ